MNRDKITAKYGITISILGLLMLAMVMAAQCGCGNSATVKPSNDMDNRLKTSLANQQEMAEKIGSLQGDLTKIQQSISTVVNTIMTQIDQRFETFQDSVSNKIGEVGRDVNTKTSKSTNSTLYGIGLVAVVLIFVLAFIWLMANVAKGAASKILK